MTTLRQLSNYRFAGRNEQAVREQWIAPLLVHLGYGPETLNTVLYETRVELAEPFRRIGRKRVQVDYTPTVLGQGLWIIEAKAPDGDAWEEAISQAWLYATHPEVDVPFMAIADGNRIAVYDTYKPDWDSPELDIPVLELEAKFSDLAGVLGAENVTRAVRARRLRHLGTAMRAEVSLARLREYVTDIEQLAATAQSAVLENQAKLLRDQFESEERSQRELVDREGLFAVGVWANQPFGVPKSMAGLATERLLETPANDRMSEFARLRDAAIYRSGPHGADQPRMFWNLRHVELFVALRARAEAGCEPLEEVAREAIRNHVLNFPNDELGRAAHRLERVLPAFAGRFLLRSREPDLPRLARELQAHWSDELRLRARIDSDRLFVEMTLRAVRALWTRIPWAAAELNARAQALERALPMMEIDRSGPAGLVGDPYFDWHYEQDMLLLATLYETGDLITPDLLDDEVVARLEEIAATDPDQARMADPAERLVNRFRAVR